MTATSYPTSRRPKQARATRFVGYVRQGRNGRGLKVQQAGVRRVVAYYRRDEPVELVGEYIDVDRPGEYRELQRAIRRAERTGAILIVGRLGRLRNDPQFLDLLFRSRVRFACGDARGAGRWTLGLMLAVARRRTSTAARTARDDAQAALLDLMLQWGNPHEVAAALDARGLRAARGARWTWERVLLALSEGRREAEQIAVAG